MKKLLILLILISSNALANINYCAVDKIYGENCSNYRKSIPWLSQSVDATELKICCNSKETYEEFKKLIKKFPNE